ncbi:alanine racemase [Exiguobacterium sp. AM39-5BH]|uniref:alanine racemase n=1 Tax=Exiguobacterium sp. AM39-5BH TaxID=2292355 RepID=UPI000FE26F3A|nr:alanine racemase [Exiguobacterium sp. AM39-5BH]RHB50167.1 alanine racemase [Exiguobacterium sp. AM39-5BH]
MFRPSWIEIDRAAIKHNVIEIKKRIPQALMAVVKANAYGHGAVEVANIALDNGATMLGVALLEEAIELREAGINAPILVMEAQFPENAGVAAEHDVTLSVFSADWLREARSYLAERPLTVHVKVDTGMGRLGLRTRAELDALLEAADDRFVVEGIYTHFATADEPDSQLYYEQQERFAQLMDGLHSRFRYIHTSNSAGAIRMAGLDVPYNLVRVGIALYGLYPSAEMASFYSFLRPAFTLKSKLMQVKQLEAGQTISYGATYTTTEDEWIGTVPVGYADGWIRKASGFEVDVNGHRCPIVGRVCMDRFMVRLPEELPIGTVVTLIGGPVAIDELATHLETINYEVVCQLTSRLPRRYV